MSKNLSTMKALINNVESHNRRCTMGVKIGDLMRDLGEKVKLGRIAHQEYYIIIDRLSQAELAKSVSHNNARWCNGSTGDLESFGESSILSWAANSSARTEGASDRTAGDIAHEAERDRVANGASNKNFTRKPVKGGCDGLGKLKFSWGGYNCVAIHGGINKYGVERTAKPSTFHAAVHCRSHEAGRYAASFINLTADPEAPQERNIGSEGRPQASRRANRSAFVTEGGWTRASSLEWDQAISTLATTKTARRGKSPLRRSSKTGNTVGAPSRASKKSAIYFKEGK